MRFAATLASCLLAGSAAALSAREESFGAGTAVGDANGATPGNPVDTTNGAPANVPKGAEGVGKGNDKYGSAAAYAGAEVVAPPAYTAPAYTPPAYTPPASSPPPPAAANPPAEAPKKEGEGFVKVHVVKVSNKKGDLTFTPADIKAAVGDLVQYQFYPKSTFDQPCQPISKSTPGVQGFKSGFMPTTPDAKEVPVFTVLVNDTKPIWFYCSQGKHCQSGMVGVINAPAANASRTLESHKALAAKVVKPEPGAGAGSPAYSPPAYAPTGLYTSATGVVPPFPTGDAGAAAGAGAGAAAGTGVGGSATNSSLPPQVTTNGVDNVRPSGKGGVLVTVAALAMVIGVFL
ncbi:MAG: hypothetical protein M1833_002081 [Piccolia ochrophora]|nr:MAG: hypothetical protein M1833_002081 [Piccolia ochrophora]